MYLFNKYAKPEDEKYVNDLFSKLGKVVYITEKLMEAATILGACGTAYAMRYIRASIQGGIEIGFDASYGFIDCGTNCKRRGRIIIAKGFASRAGN